MKKSAFTLLAFLAMTSVTIAAVTLGISAGTPVSYDGTDYEQFTVQATGIGITTLSKFEVATPVHQVKVFVDPFPDPSYYAWSEWLGDGSATGSEPADSYVVFGDVRIVGADPDAVTTETIVGVGEFGMGTLNNVDVIGAPTTWDAYLKTGVPGTDPETVDLLQLVVADGTVADDLALTLTLFTATNYVAETGVSDVTQYDLEWPASTRIVGDCDEDGDVDGTDFGNFSTGWFGNEAPEWLYGDFDEDGDVDGTDFGNFSTAWFDPSIPHAAGAAVPEPSTIVMLILGALCLVGYRVRK